MDKINKFVSKNEEPIEGIKSVLYNTKVRYAVVSTELNGIMGDLGILGKVTKLINPYIPPNQLDIIVEGRIIHNVKFNMPCVCGIYGDEVHP